MSRCNGNLISFSKLKETWIDLLVNSLYDDYKSPFLPCPCIVGDE